MKKHLFGLICLFLLILGGRGQKIYPDHYVKNDIPFLKDLEGNYFIYKARYFTNEINPQPIKNIQLGFSYEPEIIVSLLINV